MTRAAAIALCPTAFCFRTASRATRERGFRVVDLAGAKSPRAAPKITKLHPSPHAAWADALRKLEKELTQ